VSQVFNASQVVGHVPQLPDAVIDII